ncbi:MAG: LamG domain-containing protein, partial [Planctomycetota bacterium]
KFTPDFLAEMENARNIRPDLQSGLLQLNVDGSGSGDLTYQIYNPTTRAVLGTLSLTSSAGGNVASAEDASISSDWSSTLDHLHVEVPAGKAVDVTFHCEREAGSTDDLTLPSLSAQFDYLGESTRIHMPGSDQPLPLQMASVPAAYFQDQRNHALSVKSRDSVVRVESAGIQFADGPFTLEGWVKTDQLTDYRTVVGKVERSGYALFLDEGAPRFDVHVGGRYVSAIGVQTIAKNKWTHLAGVFDGTSVMLFVDGKLAAKKDATGRRKMNELPLYVGAEPDGKGMPSRHFVGQIDEVRLNTGAVYQDEFQPERRLVPDSSTKLLLHFDRRLGPLLLDHSPSATMATMGDQGELVVAE